MKGTTELVSVTSCLKELDTEIYGLVERCRATETNKTGYWRTDLDELRKDLRSLRKKEVLLRTEKLMLMSRNPRTFTNSFALVVSSATISVASLLIVFLIFSIRQDRNCLDVLDQQKYVGL